MNLLIHYRDFNPALDNQFPAIKKRPATWLIDVSEGKEPHACPDPKKYKKVEYIGREEEGWLILDKEHSHLVLNKCALYGGIYMYCMANLLFS